MTYFANLGTVELSVIFLFGLAALLLGAEALVTNSVRLAMRLNISKVVIGLTIVAFGTSMPEFVVSIVSVIKGSFDISLGNIIGSNIANIGLVLGLSAIFRKVDVPEHILKVDLPFLILISLIFWFFCSNGFVELHEAFILLGLFFFYIWYMSFNSKEKNNEEVGIKEKKEISIAFILLSLIVGIILLSIGADWIVGSGVELSHRLGISELFIGLTAVAVGTSLPELATSVVAAIKKEGSISLGNIIGSNIFNTLLVIGSAGMIKPLTVNQNVISLQLPFMIGITLLLVPFLYTNRKVTRIEAIILLILYAIFIYISF